MLLVGRSPSVNMGPSSFLFGGALTLFLGSAFGITTPTMESCVQVSDAYFTAYCPCDAGSDFSFKMEGQTSVTTNKVCVLAFWDDLHSE